MTTPIRVLLVEDSEGDAALLVRELERGGYLPTLERVDTAAGMSRALDAHEWDVVLSDHTLPAFSSSAALELLRSKRKDLAFIVVSGTIGEEKAVELMKAGADDFVLKDRVSRLVPAIGRELAAARARRDGQRLQRALDALHDIARVAGGIPDLTKLAETAVAHARTLLGADFSGLYVWDQGDQLLRIMAVDGPLDRVPATLAAGQGVPGRAFTERQPVAVDDYRALPDGLSALRPAVGSALAVPLLVSDGAVGVLILGWSASRTFASEEIRLASLFAAGVGPTIEVGRLFAESEARRVQAETMAEEMRRLALFDTLTGLPNRQHFRDQLDEVVVRGRREARSFTVLYLDLDGFKEVNDAFGHTGGDDLLRALGSRLAGGMAMAEGVARVGGDRFAVLLDDVGDYVGASLAGERAIAGLQEPFMVQDQAVYVGASVGAVVFPDHGDDAEALLRNAEVAMYAAKRSGGGFRLYAPADDPQSQHRLALAAELRDAMSGGQLVLHYQPKVRLRDGAVIGVEALVRWQHPERGLVPPDEFVPIAEQSGLIKPLTLWAIGEALRQCGRWRRAGRELEVAVNLSMRALRDPLLVDAVDRLIRSAGVPPHALMLEITEGTIMADPERSLELLRRLRDRGIRLAVDDFGTGYSSLAYLDRLPINEVKVDRSFARDVASDAGHAAIVLAATQLAHAHGLTLVAEGVEDAANWRRCLELGCDAVQGYYVSKAVPATEVTDALAAGRWTQRLLADPAA